MEEQGGRRWREVKENVKWEEAKGNLVGKRVQKRA